MRQIDVTQRRARLGVRHRLAGSAAADGANGMVAVAGDLVGLHATDPATVHLAAAARLKTPELPALERTLYDDRTVLRILGMRRTMFVLPVELAAVVHASCTGAIAARERRRLVKFLTASGIGGDDPAGWLAGVEEAAYAALVERGTAYAAELSADVPAMREQLRFPDGTSSSVGPRVLFMLSSDGRIVRSRPRGSWLSSQYQWAPVDAWLPGGIPVLPVDAARVELVRRWLAAFGPGTVADLKWWTGWPLGEVRRALAGLRPAEVDLDGQTGLVLADDLEPVPAPEPWVRLLPALDPTTMGWAGRDWYLGEHRAALFDRNGNAGPTVWADGRVVGGWAQLAGGDVVFRLLEDVGAETTAAVRAEAERLSGWFAGVRVTPRFRTPLERELSA